MAQCHKPYLPGKKAELKKDYIIAITQSNLETTLQAHAYS